MQGCAPEEAQSWLDKAAKDAEERQAQAAELEFGKELLELNIAASYPELDSIKQVIFRGPIKNMPFRTLP